MTQGSLLGLNSNVAFLHEMTRRLGMPAASGSSWELREILRNSVHKEVLDIFLDDTVLTESERRRIETCVARRIEGEPLAYIIGEAPFLDLVLSVNERTFIPRPETEELVLSAVQWLRRRPSDAPLRALDLGSGSGAIPVGISLRVPEIRFDAIEISHGALESSERNVERFGLSARVRLIEGDYRTLDLSKLAAPDGYDLVTANPPYISEKDYPALQPEVRREPLQALVGGPEGDEIIRWMLPEAARILKTGGVFILEVGIDQALRVRAAASMVPGLRHAQTRRDEQGIERVLIFERI